MVKKLKSKAAAWCFALLAAAVVLLLRCYVGVLLALHSHSVLP